MKKNLLIAVKMTLLCMVIFSGIYTLSVWAIAQFAPNQGKGFIIKNENTESGKSSYYYENIGQNFTEDRYFYSRPSAVEYNAAAGAGSNYGSSNPEYLAEVQERIQTFLKHNPGVQVSDIPSDLVTASGSGLDPDISEKAALIQVKRISRIRSIPESRLIDLVHKHTEQPLAGILGPKKVNVVKLNIDLDRLK